jgi:hypothetical protein
MSGSEQQIVHVVEVGQILVNKATLAKAFNVSRRTVDYWRERGVIPSLEFGKHFVRFDLNEVRQALEKFKVRPAVQPKARGIKGQAST